MRSIATVLVALASACTLGCGTSASPVMHGPTIDPSTPAPSSADAGAPPADGSAPIAPIAPDAAAPDAASAVPFGATPHAGGATFRVWAPHATRAWVAGDWNGMSTTADPLAPLGDGTFAADVAGAAVGQGYMYVLEEAGKTFQKPDPRGRRMNGSRGTSIVVDPAAYAWKTTSFTPRVKEESVVYEMHLGTFDVTTSGRPGTWASATAKLDHLVALGVDAVEVMPPAEFSGDFSWGYNPAFPYAAETAYGTDDDARHFVDEAHARGIGVYIDVVHNHYGPEDLALRCFDGDCLGAAGIYFFADAARASTPWGPRPDFADSEVGAFIRDNARMWLDEYRADGLRWDSTGNIRAINNGTPIPEGWQLLRAVNDDVHARHPRALQIAEDMQELATVTLATSAGGGGFDLQWGAGFMHAIDDTVVAATDAARSMTTMKAAIEQTFNGDPFQRVVYAASHDEVANGKQRIPQMVSPADPGSLVARKRATLAAAVVLTSPGVPMLFQGEEFLEDGSFTDKNPLDWTKATTYAPILAFYTDMIRLRHDAGGTTRGLVGPHVTVHHVNDTDKVIAYRRWDKGGPGDDVVVVANFGARAYTAYDVGLPAPGTWHVRMNSDATTYGADFGGAPSTDVASKAGAHDGFAQYGSVALGAYAVVVLSQ